MLNTNSTKYERKIQKNIDYDFGRFFRELDLKSRTNDGRIRAYNRHLDFSILKTPKIDFSKLERHDLEFVDNYSRIMEKRINNAEFLQNKAIRAGRYSQFHNELEDVIDTDSSQGLSIHIDTNRIMQFILRNGLFTFLSMPILQIRDTLDDLILTPLYVAMDLSDRYDIYKLEKEATRRYNEDRIREKYNPSNDYQKVEQLFFKTYDTPEKIVTEYKRVKHLNNLFSNLNREELEQNIDELLKKSKVFELSEQGFRIFDRYKDKDLTYKFTKDKEKLKKLGKVADMYERYKKMKDSEVIKFENTTFTKKDYLEHIKKTILDGFEIEYRPFTHTYSENYNGKMENLIKSTKEPELVFSGTEFYNHEKGDTSKNVADSIEKALERHHKEKEFEHIQTLKNEVAKNLNETGVNITDNDIDIEESLDTENNIIKLTINDVKNDITTNIEITGHKVDNSVPAYIENYFKNRDEKVLEPLLDKYKLISDKDVINRTNEKEIEKIQKEITELSREADRDRVDALKLESISDEKITVYDTDAYKSLKRYLHDKGENSGYTEWETAYIGKEYSGKDISTYTEDEFNDLLTSLSKLSPTSYLEKLREEVSALNENIEKPVSKKELEDKEFARRETEFNREQEKTAKNLQTELTYEGIGTYADPAARGTIEKPNIVNTHPATPYKDEFDV